MHKNSLTVWFFLGLLLIIYGVIIFFAGLVERQMPSLLWGILQCIAGGLFMFGGRRRV